MNPAPSLKFKNAVMVICQSAEGVLIEIAYSFALIAGSFAVIHLVLLFK